MNTIQHILTKIGFTFLLISALGLSACGHKGALYLPDDQQTAHKADS